MLKTALIVDDSRLARLTLKRLLVQYDIEVSEAEGVIDAERWIQHNLMPDLVFMDVMMPELDGFQGLERMRANPDTRHIPVIMYSGDISEEARKKARDHGATGYLPKPADANRLDHLLNALNKRAPAKPAAAEAPAVAEPVAAPSKGKGSYGRPAGTISSDPNNPFELAQDSFAPAHQTFKEPTMPPRASMAAAQHSDFGVEVEVPVAAKQAAAPIAAQAAAVSIPAELIHRIDSLEARVNAQAAKPAAAVAVPPEVNNRLNRLEERMSAQIGNTAQLDLTAELERQRRDVVFLQRQIAKAEHLGKIAIGVAAFAIAVALAAVIRSMM